MSEDRQRIIYLITCRATGKAYIGQTKWEAETRWASHVSMAYCGPYNYPLHHAIREYGEKAFTIEALLCCKSKADAYWAEAWLIAQHGTLIPNGYNQSHGPGRSRSSSPKPERDKLGSLDLRMRLSVAGKLLWSDPEFRARRLGQIREAWADPAKREAMTAQARRPKKNRTTR